jgi:serine/threonine-protein kinase RsbW
MAKSAVLREVVVSLRMAPEMEIEACEKASAIAESMRMSPDKIDEVKLAVIEACLNACEHSRAPRREVEMIFSVLGTDQPETLQITVRDGGIGFDADLPQGGSRRRAGQINLSKRGWGLRIIEGLMDDVKIESGSSGTTVVMSKAV